MSRGITDKRVCLIGAGPCGITLLSAFSDAKSRGEAIPQVVCFEKQEQISGLWNYTWRTGLTAHGDALPNSMYRHLWSNGPKECLEFPDYTFMDHFKKPIPSFPPRAVLQDYILGKANKYNVGQFVKTSHAVRHVEEKGTQFLVTYEDLVNHQTYNEVFDYVVCATGHYTVPHFPQYPGLDKFDGRVMHAHDFRSAEEFKNKTIVLIGSSYSAEDISLQLYKYGAKKCIISYRKNPMGYKWPAAIVEKPALIKVEGSNKFHFTDGTIEEVDDVIFCTGYQHYFPFMSQNLRLFATNIMYPDHLYKGIMWHRNPNCLYMGMSDQYYTYTMFDTQGLWIRDYVMGKINIGDVGKRSEHMKQWYDRGQALKNAVEEIEFQRDYVHDLVADMPNYPKKHDINIIAEHLKVWKVHKSEDILTYRDHSFTSPNDGHLACKHVLPWIKSFDDSIEGYVNQTEKSQPA